MAVTVKHKFVSPKPDGPDDTLLRPSDWNDDHEITGLGTAATANLGVNTGEVPVVQGNGKLPSEVIPDAIPSGCILMWSGSVATIPAGWFLCDGTNGTPDLRNRFIVGAGSTYNPGDTGGADSVTLTEAQIPAHSHTGSTNSTGSHDHGARRAVNEGGGVFGFSMFPNQTVQSTSGLIDTAGAHSHTLTINNTGGGGSHENRPPYYALCFIMKG